MYNEVIQQRNLTNLGFDTGIKSSEINILVIHQKDLLKKRNETLGGQGRRKSNNLFGHQLVTGKSRVTWH